jgi:hypothetical protein
VRPGVDTWCVMVLNEGMTDTPKPMYPVRATQAARVAAVILAYLAFALTVLLGLAGLAAGVAYAADDWAVFVWAFGISAGVAFLASLPVLIRGLAAVLHGKDLPRWTASTFGPSHPE